ncbi:MAG: hypothetical protein QM725_09885 [Lacibacter sp.]
MKLFKQTELILTAVIAAALVTLFWRTGWFEIAYIIYMIAGVCQFISLFIHFKTGWFSNHLLRNIYYFTFLLSALLAITNTGLMISFFTSPFMLLIYTFICYKEMQILRFKEFVHLK